MSLSCCLQIQCASLLPVQRPRARPEGHAQPLQSHLKAASLRVAAHCHGPSLHTSTSSRMLASLYTPDICHTTICRSSAADFVAAQPVSTPQPADGPNFTLDCPETGTTIHVFGVEHLSPQPHIGEWIIRNRPQAVVVETAMGPEHGALAGNVIRCGDQVADPTAGFFLRMFCQIGVTLQEYKDGDFTASPLWNQVRCSYNGEQLGYIGAFATGSPLVFGDRPKDITYRRLFGQTSLAQLDEGYSYAAQQNYRTFMGLPALPYDPEKLPVTEQIMMLEREAVMLAVVHQLCRNALPQQHLEGGRPRSIALVVGSAHLPGLQHLWRSGRWREVAGCTAADAPLAASHLLHSPPLPCPDTDPGYGLRRGLLEAMLRLSVTREVLSDLETVLGSVPERQSLAYSGVGEVYGSPRMQLASLPRELLERAVTGLGCDFYEALQPMRDIRPMNGGPGCSEDMVMYVRALNFELD